MPGAGDLVGPYRLVSPLGKGAMGEVWRARDERLDRYVALKILPPEDAGDLERRARQLREAKAAAAIRHPNVVTLFDIVSHDGDDILVMELVEGRTLSEALRRDGAPPLDVALRWIIGVADALVAAHARGILHRDIKAANIMITPDGIKVLDFGLAKLRDDASVIAASASRSMPRVQQIALDETMPSEPRTTALEETARPTGLDDVESYRTHAGQLLGTPLYMAPEQLAGQLPDERSEVFSVGVLAHEILTGKPPYTAKTMDELFRQITSDAPAPLVGIPRALADIIDRALAKDPGARFPSMAALRDALASERARRSSPRRGWLMVALAGVMLAIAAIAGVLWRGGQPAHEPVRPGDDVVARALGEYDTFYNEKALSSLRAALAVAPEHPRANAYLILFGGAPESEQRKAGEVARRVIETLPATSRDRTLLVAAQTLVEHGPRAAREALSAGDLARDRELAFWAAELDYRAGNYEAAGDAYRTLLAMPVTSLRGRIYDHYSSVLLVTGQPREALRIGTLYRDAFPGEADAVGVYATTLAAAGRLDDAVTAAEQALALAEGEDTLAGLAKVLAIKGDRPRAIELYARSLERAGPGRRPVRRAALALLQLVTGDATSAEAAVAPCLEGGSDSKARERGSCLFVAALVVPRRIEEIASQLDALAAEASPTRPPYGDPSALATLVRLQQQFFGGGCVLPGREGAVPPGLTTRFDVRMDFFAAYHLPFFATWALCEKAAYLAATGAREAAVRLLRSVPAAPSWVLQTATSYAAK